jgi:transposase
MSIPKASQKVNISKSTGSNYYKLYKNNPEKRISLPRNQAPILCTQEQIGNLIRYIDTDKITVKEASAKVNMVHKSSIYYYAKYLEDPNHNIPIP